MFRNFNDCLLLQLQLLLQLPPALHSTLNAGDVRKCSNATAHEATATQNKEQATPTAKNAEAKTAKQKVKADG